jgi:hypothetical protein
MRVVMSAPEREILAARLARMKGLIDALEQACSESAEQSELFRNLRAEMHAAREALKVFPSPSEERDARADRSRARDQDS